MKSEIIALVLLLCLILTLAAAELVTLYQLNSLKAQLNEGADARSLYESYRKKERFFVFIFSREQIRELDLAFFEYTIEANAQAKSRLDEQISYTKRQLLLVFS